MKKETVNVATIATMRRLAGSWVASGKEIESLWQREGKPRGKAWAKISDALWDRQHAIEDKLGPLLFKYAESNGLGKHGTNYWHPEPGCYQILRAVLGADVKGHSFHRMIRLGWWKTRGKSEHESYERAYDKLVRSMSDRKWQKYIGSYCASSPEGMGTKDLLIKLRAAYDAERKEKAEA